MRARTVCSICFVLAFASTVQASAQEEPPLGPTRDVTVRYELVGASRRDGAVEMKVTYAHGHQRVRLDLYAKPADVAPYGSVIYDDIAHHVLSLVPSQHAYYELPTAGRANPGLFLAPGMKFHHIGNKTIAGLNCTDWMVENGPSFQGTACVTDDGVVLRATRAAPSLGSLQATSVVYGPPPESTFRPDPGLIRQADTAPASR